MRTFVRCSLAALVSALALSGARPSAAPSSPAMSSTADLADKRIGVIMGSVYDGFANRTYPQATVLQFDSPADLRLAVLTGKVDAGLSDEQPLREVLRTNNDLAILGDPILTLPLGVGFRKGNTALRESFNQFLAGIRRSGVHADMVDRWMTRRDTHMPALAAPASSGTLVVGVSGGGLPYAAIQDGAFVGFDIEMVQRFAASIGKAAKFSQMPFGALIAANASGKVDMIAASIFITEERLQRIDFSDPYLETSGRAFALRANIAATPASRSSASTAPSPGGRPLLTSIDDLKDKRIGVQLGTVYDIYATKTFPNATVVQFSSYQEVTLAVSTGKVDAGLSDVDTLDEVRRANSDLVPFGKPIFSSPVAAGFNKSRRDLRDAFNDFLRVTRANGVHADMVDRWMVKRVTRMPDIPSAPTSGTLVVGMSSGGLPFNGMQDNELVGFDVELARRFAAHVGKALRITDQEFGGLIAALASGKVDTIVADMFITEERQRQIDFSDPYFEQDSVAFTRVANTVSSPESVGTGQGRPSFTQRLTSSFYSNIIAERRYLLLWDGLKATALISLLATILGTALGALVCYMRMSPHPLLRGPARVYVAVLRGTPIVVLVMIFFYVVFGSVDVNPVFVAVLAFGMNFAAYVSEMF